MATLILDINKEREELQKELNQWFSEINSILNQDKSGIINQIKLLHEIRSKLYENINQLQHKHAILIVAEQLQIEFPEINKWKWHPKQTSDDQNADLSGYVHDDIILNAEITTSLKPIGTIDKHMHKTLRSLLDKMGKKFYFVQTEEMFKRAKSKLNKMDNHDIEIRKFDLVN